MAAVWWPRPSRGPGAPRGSARRPRRAARRGPRAPAGGRTAYRTWAGRVRVPGRHHLPRGSRRPLLDQVVDRRQQRAGGLRLLEVLREAPAISSNSSSMGESWSFWMPLTTSRVSSRCWAEVKGPRFDAAVLEPVPAEVDLRGGRYLVLLLAQDLQLVLLPGLAEPELVRGVEQLGLVAQDPLLAPVRDRLVVQEQPQDAGTARPMRAAKPPASSASCQRLLDRVLGAWAVLDREAAADRPREPIEFTVQPSRDVALTARHIGDRIPGGPGRGRGRRDLRHPGQCGPAMCPRSSQRAIKLPKPSCA